MHDDSGCAEHAGRNRAVWNAMADRWVAPGESAWARTEPSWGCWAYPESEARMLPVDMSGLRALELGCGTGYVSAWMARRGASVVGLDVSERQLDTARRLRGEHGLDAQIELVHGNAESLPFEDESFDFAISEYGAALWCDPEAWLPEAHRVLRPGSPLRLLNMSPLAHLVAPEDSSEPFGRTLLRDYFSLRRLDWGHEGVEFNRPLSGWFRLFREVGFEVEDYLEPRPAEARDGTQFGVGADWARSFPHEQIWKLTKRSS